ncbi:MAG TPA: cytidylate kinase-like family protein [Candidatus Saccharimonadales bacterium]|nr:cytidylate kinase-like family protein [Candidatus Saccharimonadales bacterium]
MESEVIEVEMSNHRQGTVWGESMFNVVTIAREYGSGGAEIGRRVAELLGWKFLDKQIIERVAAMGKIDRKWAEKADEQCVAWWERVLSGFRHGGPEVYVGGVADTGVDRDSLQQFTARVIEEAGKAGNCVIVGRSSQCVLRNERHALHVMVFAPLMEKLERMKIRHPQERDLQALLRRVDSERAHYAQDYFGCDSSDRALYHLCLNSTIGVEACAALVADAVHLSAKKQMGQVAV